MAICLCRIEKTYQDGHSHGEKCIPLKCHIGQKRVNFSIKLYHIKTKSKKQNTVVKGNCNCA